MSGICGAMRLTGGPEPALAADVLDRMASAVAHRGPLSGRYLGPGVALGFRRLPVVDRGAGGQPFASEDGAIRVVADGTVLNHVELRRDLERAGHRLVTRADTEVVAHLYEQQGVQFVEQLLGDFAVAVWDERKRLLVLARDRQAVKPLYVSRRGDLVLFASEVKSLLASGLVDTTLDYEAIDAFLSLGYVPAPRTALAGVSKLGFGRRLVADGGGVSIEPYWRYPEPAVSDTRDEGEHAERIVHELDQAVRIRLRADGAVGAMLSGGLDSTIVLALMAEHAAAPVKTFAVGFAEAPDANELADARLAAEAFGADHHDLELSLTDTAVDVDELVWRADEPLSDLSQLGLLALCRLAGEHVDAALSGHGADGIFGGLPAHRTVKLAGAWDHLPLPARRFGEWGLARAGGRYARAGRVFAAGGPAERYLLPGTGFRERRDEFARGPLAELDGGTARRAVEERLGSLRAAPLSAHIYIDEQMAVDRGQHYNDRAATAGPIDIRFPFLDHRVIDYGATVPPGLKVKGLTRKYLLRQAFSGRIPAHALRRRKVGFFNAAIASWLRAQSDRVLTEYLLAPSPRYGEFLSPAAVGALVAENRSAIGQSRLLLSILMLEVWLSSSLPRALALSRREQVPVAG